MYGIYLVVAGIVLLFMQTSSALDSGSLTGLDAATAPGFVHVPVQHTAQKWNEPPMIWGRTISTPPVVELENLSLLYSINISIGGQHTTVNLDTGSYELWVDPNCFTEARFNESNTDNFSGIDVLHPSEYCNSISRYDPASSPTAKYLNERAFLSYADNSTADIYFHTDDLGIGGLEISEQQFDIAKASKFMALRMIDMGPDPEYGYDTTSLPYNLVLDSMVSQGIIASRVFSLDLRSYGDATGSIIFGGLDVKKFLANAAIGIFSGLDGCL